MHFPSYIHTRAYFFPPPSSSFKLNFPHATKDPRLRDAFPPVHLIAATIFHLRETFSPFVSPFFFYPFLIHFSSTPFSLVPFPLAFHHFPEFPFVPRNLNGENPLTPPAGRTLLLFFLKYLSSFFFFISLFHTSRNNFFWTTIQASYFQIIIRLLDSWNSKNGFSNYFKFFRLLFLEIIYIRIIDYFSVSSPFLSYVQKS